MLAVLATVAWPLFFYRLDERALWSSHEGRAGQNGQASLDTGQWGMPTTYIAGADHQKPPLYYWMVAAVASLRRGPVDAWAIRFPAAAAAVGGLWLTYWLGASLWRPATGFIAALMLATSVRYCWLARVGRIDMPLAVAVLLVLVCFWMAYRRVATAAPTHRSSRPACLAQGQRRVNERVNRVWWWMLPAYLATALAVMLKGPIGAVLPLVAIGCFLLIERQPVWPWKRDFARLADQFGLWWGVPLVVVVAGPWFAWATIVTDGAFFKTFFLHHNLNRSLGVDGLKPGPIWYYVPQLFVDLFPWSVLLPAALCCAVRSLGTSGLHGSAAPPMRQSLDCTAFPGGAWEREAERRTAWRYVLAWTVAMLVLLSLVRFKRHDYLLPVVPGVVLLLAGFCDRLFDLPTDRVAWRWSRILGWTATGAPLVTAAVAGAFADRTAAAWLRDGQILTRLLDAAHRLTLDRVQEVLRHAGPSALATGAAVLAACVLGLAAMHTRRALAGLLLFATGWAVGFVVYVDRCLPVLEPMREQRSLAKRVHEHRPAGAPLFCYGREDQQLLFYVGPEVRWLPNRTFLRQAIERPEPVFVLMELERFLARRNEWPDVTMIELARNTDNRFGTHCDPTVLVTNAAGWRVVQARRAAGQRMAN